MITRPCILTGNKGFEIKNNIGKVNTVYMDYTTLTEKQTYFEDVVETLNVKNMYIQQVQIIANKLRNKEPLTPEEELIRNDIKTVAGSLSDHEHKELDKKIAVLITRMLEDKSYPGKTIPGPFDWG